MFCYIIPIVSGNIEILGKQNSLFPSRPVIKCLLHRTKSHVSVFLKRGGNMHFHVSVIFTSGGNVKTQVLRDSVTFPERKLPSHVFAMFKLADFRYCAFPSCFCKRIYSCFATSTKTQTVEMVPWTTMNLTILPVGDELQLQPQEVPRLTFRKMTNIRQYGESALRRYQ